MIIEVELHKLKKDWWIELGITYSTTELHPEYKKVIVIALLIISIYIRWK